MTVRGGDIAAVLAVLDPDVVRRADTAGLPPHAARELRGAQAVAEQALANAQRSGIAQIALVNGAPGIVVGRRGRLVLALNFTIRNDKIAAIDVVAGPARLRRLNLAVLDR